MIEVTAAVIRDNGKFLICQRPKGKNCELLWEFPGGKIEPFGPVEEYVGEKKADMLTLMVYPGADGSFCLYEDDGTTYAYEKGEYSMIPMHYSEAEHTLTIGARQGAYPGMLAERTFVIRIPGSTSVQQITYTGQQQDIPLL